MAIRKPSTNREGLILLVVVGMLALFTVLSVSFVVMSRSSLSSSTAIARVKSRTVPQGAYAEIAMMQVLRGTTDPNSFAFGHDLLADIYGQRPLIYSGVTHLKGYFRNPASTADAPRGIGVYGINGVLSGTRVQFLKLPLDRTTLPQLDVDTDAYSGRVFTFLGGPLAGYSFRIVSYIGRGFGALDPLQYSVLIHVEEMTGKTLSARVGGTLQTRLFEDWNPADFARDSVTNRPYQFLINDPAFTGLGYGLKTSDQMQDPSGPGLVPDPDYGNLGQVAWTIPDNANPSVPATGSMYTGIPVGLLHSYPESTTWRFGDTNEGMDVADSRDMYLALQTSKPTSSRDVIPSYHRPEVINYIAQLYGNPNSFTVPQLLRFLNLLDYASARPLSYNLKMNGTTVYKLDAPFSGTPKSRNIGFRAPVRDNPLTPAREDQLFSSSLELNLNLWGGAGGTPPAEVARLQNFVAWLVNGPWDIDNDGDNVNDTLWNDPNLPLIVAPDGKLVKVLVGPLIEDLDGRINLNTAGDMVSADPGFLAGTNSPAFAGVPADGSTGIDLPQGFGTGPADISVSSIIQATTLKPGFNIFSYTQSVFDMRYGTDDRPGITGATMDDPASRLHQRHIASIHAHRRMPGLPLSRRAGIAMGQDRLGNPILRQNSFGGVTPISETNDDGYESRPNSTSPGDHPFSMAELEALLRRYDGAFEVLPERLRQLVEIDVNYNVNKEINRLLTTRSSELKLPAIGAFGVAVTTPAATTIQQPSNMLEWVELMYEARYRQGTATIPQVGTGGGTLTRTILKDYLPFEFRKSLRMNANRPFGNDLNEENLADNAGVLENTADDPEELQNNVQYESSMIPGGASPSQVTGEYGFSYPTTQLHLSARKRYARQLYILAQLIVPRDYILPGMQGLTGPFTATTPAGATFRKRRARILAQWAVNVVDFRDSDAAMTRFEFDEVPFGFDTKTPGWVPQVGNVVWGLEFPELCLTESLALHDKSTKDTAEDSSMQKKSGGDSDEDQYRLPKGSLFLELMALRSTGLSGDATLPAVPSSLYETTTGTNSLHLARTAPDGSPVWRIGLSGVHAPTTSPNETLRTPGFASQTYQLSGTVEGASADLSSGLYSDLSVPPPGTAPTFDRLIVFTTSVPTTNPNLINDATEKDHRVFVRGSTYPEYLNGGSYLVIGPRANTVIGSQDSSVTPPTYMPSPQRIAISNTNVSTYKLDGTVENPWQFARQNPVGMVCTAAPPSNAWDALMPAGGGQYRVGLNISEPVSTPAKYYQIPTERINPSDGGFNSLPMDSWRNYQSSTGNLPNTPFDHPTASPVNEELNNAARPCYELGTYPNFKTAYLQRLADPELPYNAVTNPYITIDWISMDLTVYTGEDTNTVSGANKFAFQSRYKDGADANGLEANSGLVALPGAGSLPTEALPARKTSHPTIGTQMITYSLAPLVETPTYTGPPVATTGAAAPAFFNYQLGYSSYPAGVYTDTADPLYRGASASTLGYLNVGRPLTNNPMTTNDYDGFGPPLNSPPLNALPPGQFDGMPQNPVSSYQVFNRNFATPYEMMMVSYCSPGQLAQCTTVSAAPATNLYAPPAASPRGLSAPFGHLFNFFESSDWKVTNGGTPTPFFMQTTTARSDLHLLLDLVETPQQYSDSATFFDARLPRVTEAATSGTGFDAETNMVRARMLDTYLAPFNSISSYVNSGKVNINTIVDERVWKAVHSNYLAQSTRAGDTFQPPQLPLWTEMVLARQGFVTPSPTGTFFTDPNHLNPTMSPDFPTRFVGAARSSFTGNIAADPLGAGNLRANASDTVGLARRSAVPPNTVPALGGLHASGLGIYSAGTYQPSTAYLGLSRLSNLVSNQSNVFCVRMTVGFFEFDPVTGIGAEVSGRGGDMRRQQSLFIIDRSIPVGYIPGEDLNVDKTILFRRQVR